MLTSIYVYLSVYLFIYPSLYALIYPSIYLFTHQPIHPSFYPSRCTTCIEQLVSSLDEEEQVRLALRLSLQQSTNGMTTAGDNSGTINGSSQLNLHQLISAGYTRTEAMHILRGKGGMQLLREKERVNRRNGHQTQLHKPSDALLPLPHRSSSTYRGSDKASTQQNSKQQQQQQLPTSGQVHQHHPINLIHHNNTDHHRDDYKKKDREVGASRGMIPQNNFYSRSPHVPTTVPIRSQTHQQVDNEQQPKKKFLSRFF